MSLIGLRLNTNLNENFKTTKIKPNFLTYKLNVLIIHIKHINIDMCNTKKYLLYAEYIQYVTISF